MQIPSKRNLSLDKQIDFIAGAKNIVSDPKRSVVHDIDNLDMLKSVQESLEELSYFRKTKNIGLNTPSVPYLKWVVFQANEFYFMTLKELDVIVDTETFTEYKHKARQVYLRHAKCIGIDDTCVMYIEPQVNMNRSIREGASRIKIQLSLLPYHNLSKFSNPVATKMNNKNLIEYLNLCESWESNFWMCLMDESELDFNQKEVSNG
jgi:hypothetical protein